VLAASTESCLKNPQKRAAKAHPGAHFVGRLATYKYYNMDQVVAQALTTCARLFETTRAELVNGRANGATLPASRLTA
jgi:UDP-galactopyranose mutase